MRPKIEQNIERQARMANTSNASRFILNIVELQNTITSAGGTNSVNTLSNAVSQLQQMVNYDQKQIKANIISRFNTTPITVTDSLNLSNATLYSNGTVASVGVQSTLSSGPTTVTLLSTTTTTPAFEVAVGSPSVTPFQVLGDGSLRLPNAGTPTIGYYLTCTDTNGTAEWQPAAVPSDLKLKGNIRPLDGADTIVSSLRGVRFNWASNGKEDIGMIAQEVSEVVPEAITSYSSTLMIQYQTLVPILLESVKSLQARVSTLEGLAADAAAVAAVAT